MKITSIETAPAAPVQAAAEHGGHERSTSERSKAPTAPASAEEPPVARPVKLPEFAHYELLFRLDEERGRVVVQVIDAKTGTIVRTVPPEDLGRAVRRLPDPRGLLLDRES